MVDLTINSLRLQVSNAAGYEHRIGGIARRAATILGERLNERYAAAGDGPPLRHIDAVVAPALQLNLGHFSDGEAAERIASAWFDAHLRHLGI